ncbi:uncharacterized protein ATC70_007118 [Mucor velutinosus]|uniref:NDT80 domain-containing protein n=1 Tax=Mucor velutinosus TaxID=708070 RepID=A0AAN7D407_9FUNG|nr:hypothetical protein ATC70_007118 [Mucor velutinosus]
MQSTQDNSNKWTSPPDTPRNYMPLQPSYPYSNTEYNPQSNVLPGLATQPSMHGLMAGSQPSTPRPDIISPPPDKISSITSTNTTTTPDLIRRRPPLPSRPASFTTTTFHSNPYPGSVSLRRRRTESSMFSFETGPSFSQTKQFLDLWNIDQTNGHQVQLHAKMDRGFFRADQDWTCYRRNYFQVSATFDVHGMNYAMQGPEVPCLLRTENQEIHQIDFFSIGVSARVSGSDKKIELVQHTPKRDKGPQMIPEPRVVSAGGNLHLASVGSNHNIVTFERMQFKTATANNGKRRAAQQYYEIVVDLCANSSTGKQFKVASCTSAPLVVRGRSPGHYADSHTRYRSMDAGTPSTAPFGSLGQGAAGSTTNPSLPPPPPLPATNSSSGAASSSSGSGPGVSDDHHHYMPSPQQQRPYGPSMNSSASNGNPDFGNPYSSYHQQQQPPPPSDGYPYPVASFAPVLTTPPMGASREDEGHRESGYMMHPYATQPSQHPSSHQDSYYDNNHNNGHPSNDVYGNHPDNKPYWNNRDPQLQQPNNARYSSNGPHANSSPYDFNGYNGNSVRPQQQSTNEHPSEPHHSLDAGRSIKSDNRQCMHHSSANSH